MRRALILVALLTCACGSGVPARSQSAASSPELTSSSAADSPSVAASPTVAPYSGPLFIDVPNAGGIDPRVRGGAAAAALECAGNPENGNGNAGMGNSDFATPTKALHGLIKEGFLAPDVEYRVERREPDRVLFSYDVEGRTKVAVITSNAVRPGYEPGWYVESVANCDPAEFPAPVADAMGVQVWTDGNGERVPTTLVQSRMGQAHCHWQSVTFLLVGDEQFLGDPLGVFGRGVFGEAEFKESFAADVAVPADAKDTGFERNGRHLWIAADRSAAYVGTRETAERWPAPTEQVGCA